MNGISFTHKVLKVKLPVFIETGRCITRRPIIPQPTETVHELKEHSTIKGYWIPYAKDWRMVNNNPGYRKDDCGYKPRYHTGEVVYLRELWATLELLDNRAPRSLDTQTPIFFWGSDRIIGWGDRGKWRSPMSLRECHARHFAEVTVRPERLQDITAEDCEAEGLVSTVEDDLIGQFKKLWNSCYPLYPWALNPWVWRIELKRVERPPEVK